MLGFSSAGEATALGDSLPAGDGDSPWLGLCVGRGVGLGVGRGVGLGEGRGVGLGVGAGVNGPASVPGGSRVMLAWTGAVAVPSRTSAHNALTSRCRCMVMYRRWLPRARSILSFAKPRSHPDSVAPIGRCRSIAWSSSRARIHVPLAQRGGGVRMRRRSAQRAHAQTTLTPTTAPMASYTTSMAWDVRPGTND